MYPYICTYVLSHAPGPWQRIYIYIYVYIIYQEGNCCCGRGVPLIKSHARGHDPSSQILLEFRCKQSTYDKAQVGKTYGYLWAKHHFIHVPTALHPLTKPLCEPMAQQSKTQSDPQIP